MARRLRGVEENGEIMTDARVADIADCAPAALTAWSGARGITVAVGRFRRNLPDPRNPPEHARWRENCSSGRD